MKKDILATASAVVLFMLAGPGVAADWSGVDSREILMFQPGQSAWAWLVVPSKHDGARRMREGKNCLYCHEGEEEVIGRAIGSGERLDPDPMPGMPYLIALKVRVMHDAERLHVQLSWPAVHGARPAGDAEVPTRVTVMFGSEAIPATAIGGCWISCHTDLPGMPDARTGNDLTKYLPNSRTRMTATGGGDKRSDAELATEMEQGRFLGYMRAELGDGGLTRVYDGYILDARHVHEDTMVKGKAVLDGGRWTVTMSRPLAPGGKRLALAPGQQYTLMFALHENFAEGRHHYVSFPLSMTIERGEADVVVRELR